MSELGARLVETFVSEWDLSGKQYRAVHIGSANNKVVCNSQVNLAGAFGIVLNKPSSGEAARVAIVGFTKAITGDTVTRNTYLVPNATGFLVAATLPGSANVVASALESCASGSVVNVLLMPHFRTA